MHLKRAGPHLSLPHDDDDDDDEHADSTCTLQGRERERERGCGLFVFFERGKNVTNPPFKRTSVTSSFSTIQQYLSGNLMSPNSTHPTGP